MTNTLVSSIVVAAVSFAGAAGAAGTPVEDRVAITSDEASSPPDSQLISPDRSGLTTVFSNIDYKNHDARYQKGGGTTLEGSEEGIIWLAVPFTPKKDMSIYEVDTAITYADGPMVGFTMSITEDSGGFPGKVLAKRSFKNPPPLSECCKLDRFVIDAGVPVSGGQTYWITATTNEKQAGASLAWEPSVLQSVVSGAWWVDERGWVPFGFDNPGPAYAVFGK